MKKSVLFLAPFVTAVSAFADGAAATVPTDVSTAITNLQGSATAIFGQVLPILGTLIVLFMGWPALRWVGRRIASFFGR